MATSVKGNPPDYFAKHQKAEEHLFYLKQLLEVDKPVELVEKYRLLPLTPLFLVASHYTSDRIVWAVKTKWNLFKIFDKDLKKGGNIVGIKAAIASAILSQQKIVLLRKIFAALMDPSKKVQEKALAYSEIEQVNPSLYSLIKHYIWCAQGKNPDLKDKKIDLEPDSQLNKTVLKKMICLLKEGHLLTDTKEDERAFLALLPQESLFH